MRYIFVSLLLIAGCAEKPPTTKPTVVETPKVKEASDDQTQKKVPEPVKEKKIIEGLSSNSAEATRTWLDAKVVELNRLEKDESAQAKAISALNKILAS